MKLTINNLEDNGTYYNKDKCIHFEGKDLITLNINVDNEYNSTSAIIAIISKINGFTDIEHLIYKYIIMDNIYNNNKYGISYTVSLSTNVIKYLAEHCKVSKSSIIRAINNLRNKGVIFNHISMGKVTPALYTINKSYNITKFFTTNNNPKALLITF